MKTSLIWDPETGTFSRLPDRLGSISASWRYRKLSSLSNCKSKQWMVNSPPLYSLYPSSLSLDCKRLNIIEIVVLFSLFYSHFPVEMSTSILISSCVHVLRVSAKYLKSNENMTAHDVWGINCPVLRSVKCFKHHKKRFQRPFWSNK